MKKGKLLYLSS